MSRWSMCPTCGDFTDMRHHKCADRWECWEVDSMNENDAQVFHGHEAQDAAEKAAEQWGTEDGFQSEQTIMVRPAGTSMNWRKFAVTGELVPQFNATEVK